jgi:hypothetical protein
MSSPFPPGVRITARYVTTSLLRVGLAVVVVLVSYAVIPVSTKDAGSAIVLMVLSIVAFTAVLVWQVRVVLNATHPGQRALEALAFTGALFLCLFALQYLATDTYTPGAFTTPLDKFTALYYTMVVFATVGFGDITPVSTTARTITMVQMVGGLVFIGAGVKVLTMAARSGVQHQFKQD